MCASIASERRWTGDGQDLSEGIHRPAQRLFEQRPLGKLQPVLAERRRTRAQ
jgi:hypothetical protein